MPILSSDVWLRPVSAALDPRSWPKNVHAEAQSCLHMLTSCDVKDPAASYHARVAGSAPMARCSMAGSISNRNRYPLCHAAGDEAADRGAERTLDRPDHGPARTIGLGNDGIIGHCDPHALKADTE